MKKTMLALAFAGFAASQPALASDHGEKPEDHFKTPNNTVYTGVSYTGMGLDDSAVALKLGYNRLLLASQNDNHGISVDIEGTGSVVSAGMSDYDSLEASYVSVGGYARYTYGFDGLGRGWDAYFRAGMVYSNVDVFGIEASGANESFGGGLSRNFSNDWSVYLDYTGVGGNASLDEATFGVRYSY